MSSGKFLGGLLIGGALGAVIGLLLAPRSGEETRDMLRGEFNDRMNRSLETVKSKTSDLKDMAYELKGRAYEFKGKALQTAEVLKDRGQQIASDLEEAGREALHKLRAPSNINGGLED
jgi:gas vesicle protein